MRSPCEKAERKGDDASDEVVQDVLPIPRDWLSLLVVIIPPSGLLSENSAEILTLEVSNRPDVQPEDLIPRGRVQLAFGGATRAAPPYENALTCPSFTGLVKKAAGNPFSRRASKTPRPREEQNMKDHHGVQQNVMRRLEEASAKIERMVVCVEALKP